MIKSMLSNLRRLHRDERGAEGIEKFLIIAAIVLPLLGALIYYSKEIMQWVHDIWSKAKTDSPQFDTTVSTGLGG
jgi:Flp pilus assembly pilin Flp